MVSGDAPACHVENEGESGEKREKRERKLVGAFSVKGEKRKSVTSFFLFLVFSYFTMFFFYGSAAPGIASSALPPRFSTAAEDDPLRLPLFEGAEAAVAAEEEEPPLFPSPLFPPLPPFPFPVPPAAFPPLGAAEGRTGTCSSAGSTQSPAKCSSVRNASTPYPGIETSLRSPPK